MSNALKPDADSERSPERVAHETPSTPGTVPVGTFAWTAHPARERPVAGIVALLIVTALAEAVNLFTGSVGWAMLASAVLVLSLRRFFLPTRFVIDEHGIVVSALFGTTRVPWDAIVRVSFGARAAWLSLGDLPGWRESRRGVLLLFGRRREDVLAHLRTWLPAARC